MWFRGHLTFDCTLRTEGIRYLRTVLLDAIDDASTFETLTQKTSGVGDCPAFD